ncbi:hypothetical protein ACVNNN_19685 [Lysinibacillus fusiformis]|uniref:hypothetical protein n=1 Tax=Lysinibacillus sp. PWR01 TaxID=3342384 RepID=UPI00372D00B1
MSQAKEGHLSHISRNIKLYFLGGGYFLDEFITPYEYVEKHVSSYNPMKNNELYLLTQNEKEKYVINFDTIRNYINGTGKIDISNLYDVDQIGLSVLFNCNPNIQPICVSQGKHFDFDLMRTYGIGYIHIKTFNSTTDLLNYVKTIPTSLVKNMNIFPLNKFTLLEDIYGEDMLYYLNRLKDSIYEIY